MGLAAATGGAGRDCGKRIRVKTIDHETWINAARATIFAAITTRDGLDAWWGRVLRAEQQVGFVVEFDHGLGQPMLMKITDLVPDATLTWECISNFSDPNNPASEWTGHRIAFELSDARDDPAYGWLADRMDMDLDDGKDVTILRFSHSGWEDESKWRAFCNTGWGEALSELKRYCEAGSSASIQAALPDEG